MLVWESLFLTVYIAKKERIENSVKRTSYDYEFVESLKYLIFNFMFMFEKFFFINYNLFFVQFEKIQSSSNWKINFSLFFKPHKKSNHHEFINNKKKTFE